MELEDTTEIEEGSPPPLSRQPQHAPLHVRVTFPFHDLSFPNPTVAGSGFAQQEQQQNASQHGQSSFAASSVPAAAAQQQQQHGGTENAAAFHPWESSRPTGHGYVPGHVSSGREDADIGMKLVELHKLQKVMQQNLEYQKQQLMMQLQANHTHYTQQQQQQQQQEPPQPPQPPRRLAVSVGLTQRPVLQWEDDAQVSNDNPSGSIVMSMPRMPSGLLNTYLDSYSSASERRSLLAGHTRAPTPPLPTTTEQRQQQQQPHETGLQRGYMPNQNPQQQAILYNNARTAAREIGSAASTIGQEAASHQPDTSMSPEVPQQNEVGTNDAMLTGSWQQQDVRRRRSDPFLQWQFTANHSGRSAATDTLCRLQQQEEISHSQPMAAPQQQSQLYQGNNDMDIQEEMNIPLNFSNLFDKDDVHDDADGKKEKLDHSVIHGGFHPMLMNQSSIIPNYAQQQQQQQQSNPSQPVGTIGATLPQPAGIWPQQQRQETSFELHGSGSTCSSVAAFSRSTHSSTNLHERILKLDEAIEKSMKSQRMLQAWDTKMGLRKCHSKTMRSTTTSRKKVQEMMVSTIMRTGATAFLFPKQA